MKKKTSNVTIKQYLFEMLGKEVNQAYFIIGRFFSILSSGCSSKTLMTIIVFNKYINFEVLWPMTSVLGYYCEAIPRIGQISRKDFFFLNKIECIWFL